MVCSRYPKECRYYETGLKRKCLTKLKNNVWESKTKWKLVEKATYHWKNKLLCKYFSLWMGYVIERYRKEIRMRIAVSHHDDRLKAKGILALKKNIERNCILIRVCRKKYEWNVKFRTWHQWKHYIQKRQKVREIKLLANRIREERLRIRYIYLWSFRLNEKRYQVNACKKVSEKYETKVKEKCFKSWKLFYNRRNFKKKIENLAIACHKDRLLEKSFLSWKDYFFRKKRYKNQIKIIQRFHENYLIQTYIEEWWMICKKVKLDRKHTNNQTAIDFYTRKLLQKCFGSLRKVREEKSGMNKKMKAFRARYENIYITFYMNVWMTKKSEKILWNIYENKAIKWRENYLLDWALMKLMEKYNERIIENDEMSKVVKYYNCIIIERAFRGWTEVTIRKLNKKIKAQNACEFYEEKLLRRAYKKWKGCVLKKSQKKMADEYYRSTLLFRCINQWRLFIEERRMRIKEATNLERICTVKLMKKVFTCWKDELEVVKKKNIAAVHFHNRAKISKAFYKWRKFTQTRIIKKNRYESNKMIICSIIIKSAILRWNEVYLKRQYVNEKLEKFRIKREKRLIRLCFVSWNNFVEKMKQIRKAVLYYPQMKCCLVLEGYIGLLVEALHLKKVAKRKEELARRTEEKLLKRKYLKKMVSFVCWKKEKLLRCMSEERRKEAREILDPVMTKEKGTRRKPIIPDYLKSQFQNFDFEDKFPVDEETFKIETPVNRKLPVIDRHGTFVFYDT